MNWRFHGGVSLVELEISSVSNFGPRQSFIRNKVMEKRMNSPWLTSFALK